MKSDTAHRPPHSDLFSAADLADLVSCARALYPHEGLSNAPYVRTIAKIVEAASRDAAMLSVLRDGLTYIRGTSLFSLADVSEERIRGILRDAQSSLFFETLRGSVAWNLYDDHEVWEFIGYPGAAFGDGGYLHRGFNDLQWLPEPRIEENGESLVEIGALAADDTAADDSAIGTVRSSS